MAATIPVTRTEDIEVATPSDVAALRAELLAAITNIQPPQADVTRAEFDDLVARVAAMEGGQVDPPPPPPPPSGYADYEALLTHPDFVDAISYRDQAEIDAHTDKAENNPSGSNEGVAYDPAEDAAALIVASSMITWNRAQIRFAPVNTGILTCIWDYKPSGQWLGNDGDIQTHKMFMTGSWVANDRRTLEQRFHYVTASDGTWKVDTRPYFVGTAEGNLGRIEPYNETFVTVDQWHRFRSVVDFTKPVPEYSVYVDDQLMYDAVPLPTLLENQKSIDFFDPTWCNTSQSSGKPPRVHGWLRNAVVLWNQG